MTKKAYTEAPTMQVVKVELAQMIATSATVNGGELPGLGVPADPTDLVDPTGALSRINMLTGGDIW